MLARRAPAASAAASPPAHARERVHALDRHRELGAQQAEHVRRLGQEPLHVAASTSSQQPGGQARRVTGSVTIQPSAISRTSRPVHVVPAVPAAADADDRGRHDLRGRDRRAERRGGDDHGRPTPPWVATPSSGCRRTIPRPIVRTIRQPPSAVPSVSASAQADRRPRRRAELARAPVGDEQRGDHPDRLLRVVGAVAEGERRRRRPARRRAPARASVASRAGPARRSAADRQQRRRARRAAARRRARPASSSTPAQWIAARPPPTPGADQAADERVPGAGRQPARPRQRGSRPPRRPARRRSRRRPRPSTDDATRPCPPPPPRAAAARAG